MARMASGKWMGLRRRWRSFPSALTGLPLRGGGIGAFAIYSVASTIFFGVRMLPDPQHSFVGFGRDARASMWFLSWWPYAMLHGLNPFWSDLVWAPAGFNLAWATSIPGPSLIAAPITLTLGPVSAYNLLVLMAPTLSAWAAYVLCRRVTGAFWPSVAGGYIFGFSSYELGHLLGHLNLSLVFIPPLIGYLLVLRFQKTVRPTTFISALTLLLLLQFSVSIEVFATMTVFGAAAFALALPLLAAPERARMRDLSLLIIPAYLIAAVVLSPFFYYLFAYPGPSTPNPAEYVSDLLNFIVPTPFTLFGGRDLEGVAKRFTGNYPESGAYLGAPLLLVVLAFCRTHWRRPFGKLLVVWLTLVCLASLGPRLHVGGADVIWLPWSVALRLPLLHRALPGRFMMYASMLIALMLAMWLNTSGLSRWRKTAVALSSMLFIVPTVPYPKSRVDVPEFFSRGMYRQYLTSGQNTLVIPSSKGADAMVWQAQTDMYFRMVRGHTGPRPAGVRYWKIEEAFDSGVRIPHYTEEIQAFVRAHDVRTIVIVDDSVGIWEDLFRGLEVEPARVADVTLYQLRTPVVSFSAKETSVFVHGGCAIQQKPGARARPQMGTEAGFGSRVHLEAGLE